MAHVAINDLQFPQILYAEIKTFDIKFEHVGEQRVNFLAKNNKKVMTW